MKKLSPTFVLTLCLGLILIFSSCEEQCDPVDVDALNALYLRFDTDGGPGSFSPTELDSIYIIRFQETTLDSFNFPVDTIPYYQQGFYDGNFGMRIGRNHPSGIPQGPPYYSEYKYLFRSYGQDWQVRLQKIDVQGGFLDDCNYETRLKQFVLNDDTIEVTGSTEFIKVFKD